MKSRLDLKIDLMSDPMVSKNYFLKYQGVTEGYAYTGSKFADLYKQTRYVCLAMMRNSSI